MKTRRTILSILLCASLTVTVLGGCGKPKDAAETTAAGSEAGTTAVELGTDGAESNGAAGVTMATKDGKYEPAIALTTVRGINDMMQSKGLDRDPEALDDNIWYRDFKDILGIELTNEWSVPDAQYKEKMNAQIASNDLPDFFRVDAAQLKMLVDYEMAYDLTDVYAEHACDFTNQMMEADNHVGLNQATIDGKLYALPLVTGNRDNSTFWWVRKDWMDNLGIEEPKTMDELIDMCYRFARDDPDGNGKDDTIGMGLHKELFDNTLGVNAFGEGFHAYLGKDAWVEVDGKLEFGGIQPEAKNAFERLAKMYQDGILDKEFIVKDSSKISEELIAGKIGVVSGSHGMAFWPLQDVKNNDPKAEFVALSIVSADDKPAKTMLNGSATDFYVVNANCKNPEAVVKMYNYFYLKDPALSPEFDFRYHGKMDSDLEWPVDECYLWSPMIPGYPKQNLFIHQSVEACVDGTDPSLEENYWIKDNLNQHNEYLAGDNGKWSTYAWSGPGDYSAQGRIDYYEKNNMFLQNSYIGANTDAMVQYNATLNQLRLETMTKIIMGEVPIDEFDNFVDQWKTLGGEQITQEVNANRGE